MNSTVNTERSRSDLGELARQNATLGLRAIRLVLHAVLTLLRPIVCLFLLLLTLVCAALMVFSLTFPPGTHFPGVLISVMGLMSLAGVVGYSALLDVLQPRSAR